MTYDELGEYRLTDEVTIRSYFEDCQMHSYIRMEKDCIGFFKYLLRVNKSAEEKIEDSLIIYEIDEGRLKLETMTEKNNRKAMEWFSLKKKYEKEFFGTVFEFIDGRLEDETVQFSFDVFNSSVKYRVIYMFGYYVYRKVIEEGYVPFFIVYHGNNFKKGKWRVPHFHCFCYRDSDDDKA